MPDTAVIEDVEIARPGYTLPSAITLPASDGATPCVVFFAGSGPTDEDGTDLATIYGPEKLERLVAIKRAWDPDNVFRSNHNIRP